MERPSASCLKLILLAARGDRCLLVTRGCRLQKGQDFGGEIRHTVARFLENRLSLSMLAKKHPSLNYAIRQAFAIKLARFLSDISFLHSTPFFYQLHTQATSKPLSTANTAYRLLEWMQVTFLHLEPSKNPLESPTLLLPLFTPLHFTPPGIVDPAFPTSHFSYTKLLNPTSDSPISTVIFPTQISYISRASDFGLLSSFTNPP